LKVNIPLKPVAKKTAPKKSAAKKTIHKTAVNKPAAKPRTTKKSNLKKTAPLQRNSTLATKTTPPSKLPRCTIHRIH